MYLRDQKRLEQFRQDIAQREQRKLEKFKHDLAHMGRLAEFTHALELASLKYLFLINGGAAIAFMALLGTGIGERLSLIYSSAAIGAWGLALGAAMVSARMMYFSQFYFYKGRSQQVKAGISRPKGRDQDAERHADQKVADNNDAFRYRRYGHTFNDISVFLFFAGTVCAILSYIDPLHLPAALRPPPAFP